MLIKKKSSDSTAINCKNFDQISLLELKKKKLVLFVTPCISPTQNSRTEAELKGLPVHQNFR